MTEATASSNGGLPTVVLVHGGFADGSGWQGVYSLLKDEYSVRIVQEPNLSHEGDVTATKMIIGQQSELGRSSSFSPPTRLCCRISARD